MATQVVLLQKVENLGEMGDVVKVRPGYARNYLLPQKKALRASKENMVYFEARKKHLQAENDQKRAEAETIATKIKDMKVPLIRQASEAGQLFGSVTARDIAQEVAKASKEDVQRTMVQLNQNFKLIGLFPVDLLLHPEVKVSVTINIARSAEEAEIQAKTGKALIAESEGEKRNNKKPAKAAEAAPAEDPLAAVLEDSALEAQREKQAEDQPEQTPEQAS